MKYSIMINQFAFTQLFPELDIIDAAILDFITSFFNSTKIEKMTDENGDWYWISYQNVADQMPIIGIKSRDGIYRRIRNLIDEGILEMHPHNEKNQKTYLRPGPRFDEAHYVPTDENGNPRIVIRPTHGKPSGAPSDDHPTNKTINDKTINDKGGQSVLIEKGKHPLVKHIEENFPRIAKMREPLTDEQSVKLLKDYKEEYPKLFPTDKPLKEVIHSILQELNDHKNTTKRFSANRNIRTFLNNHIEWNMLTVDEGGRAKKPKGRVFNIHEANTLFMNNFGGSNGTGTVFDDVFDYHSGEGKDKRFKLNPEHRSQIRKWTVD